MDKVRPSSRWLAPAHWALFLLLPAGLGAALHEFLPQPPRWAVPIEGIGTLCIAPDGSGQELQADIIVTATGLKLLAWGGIRLTVDGAAVELGECVTYKGLMLGNVRRRITSSTW